MQERPHVPPQPSSAKQTLEISVINVGCTGTRLKTAKIQETHLQVPEESLNRGNCDVIQVQQLDNYESYFEYESGSGNINVNFFIFLKKYKHFRLYYGCYCI